VGMLDYALRIRTRARLVAGEHVHWVASSHRRRYITAVLQSTPPWVDVAALKSIQYRARCLTEMTGVPHEVDHIVPLNHPRVCGLTVPWNLEIVTARHNSAKSNRWCPEQMELW
jgi:5-methylcytosine-specific restriction endonuclease McrA